MIRGIFFIFFLVQVLVIFACYTTVRERGSTSPRRIIPQGINGAGNCHVSVRDYCRYEVVLLGPLYTT